MQNFSTSRSLRLVVRPILGCALVAACAMPIEAQLSSVKTQVPSVKAQVPSVKLGAAEQRRPFALWSESAQKLRDSLGPESILSTRAKTSSFVARMRRRSTGHSLPRLRA